MNMFRLFALVAALLIAVQPATAQWQTPNHSVPVGQGAGTTGFRNAAPGATNLPLTSNGAAADPSFRILTPAGGGTGADNSVNAASDVLASNGTNGNFVHAALMTLFNSACTVSPSTCMRIFGYVNPIWYGAVCDGTTDDALALQAAITASAGKVILLPSGSGCSTNTTLALPTGTTIKGVGRDASSVIGRTVNALPIFNAVGSSNVTLQDFSCTGTNSAISWVATNFGCASWGANTAPVSNINFINLKLSGFNTTYWLHGFGGTGAGSVTGYRYENILATSALANVPTDATLTNNTNAALVVSSGSGGSGRVINGVITGNSIAADYFCMGIINYGNHYRAQITDNLITNAGQIAGTHCTNAIPATNAYGILMYDNIADGNPAINFLIARNVITAPLSAGIYAPGDGNPAHTAASFNSSQSIISDNLIIGQTAQDESILPRGAIVISSYTDVAVIGNQLFGNFGGVTAVGQITGTINIEGNNCATSTAAAAGTPYCVLLGSGSAGSANTDTRSVRSNLLQMAGTGTTTVRSTSSTGARFNVVDISGNTINSAFSSLNLNSSFTAGLIAVTGNVFSGANSSFVANVAGITGTFTLANNMGLSFTAATLPVASNGSNAFATDGAPASACTGGSTGSNAFRQNGAWKCL